MKRLIKKIKIEAQFLDGFKANGEECYIYVNPNSKEMKELLKDCYNNSIRGIIGKDNNVYVWNGEILHNNVVNNCSQIVDGLRFNYNDKISFYLTPQYDINTFKNTLLNNMNKLAFIGIMSSTEIDFIDTTYYGAPYYPIYDNFLRIKDILTYEDNENTASIK
jgi:hypothetical protein